MRSDRQDTGRKGEEQACIYLRGLGQSIVARNWRSSHQEIDIVSLTEGVLHFVEVKTRTAPAAADPALNVNYEKRGNLVKGARAFLNSKTMIALPDDLEISFDVITVIFHKGDDRYEIEYYPNAFVPIYV